MKYMDLLEKYLTENEINTLLKKVENNYRGNILTKHYFVKMGKNVSDFFYNSIVNEIELYNQNKDNKMFPLIIDSYIDEEVCVLVLKRVNATILANDRYMFDIEISNSIKKKIVKELRNIKELKPNKKVIKYHRETKFLKYFNNSKSELPLKSIKLIDKIFNVLCNSEVNYVVSHGDINLSNIMIEDKQIKFIDWEYMGLRPETYDLAHFLLFSCQENAFIDANHLGYDAKFTKELYKDGIYICLKEISKLTRKKKEENSDTGYLDAEIKKFVNELNNLLLKFVL